MEVPTDARKSTVVPRPPIKFLVGIEDKPYFHWQLPILAESLCNKIPEGWELLVVISNNHAPLSEDLTRILVTYDLTYFTAPNHAATHAIDFSESPKGYLAWNRIQPLAAVAEHVNNDDLVCLMDTDIFLYQDLNLGIFPTGNALGENWHIKKEPFFSSDENPKGIHLQTLLKAIGCSQPFKPGGVFVFLTGKTIKNAKFVQDCFRFTQILYLAGKIADQTKEKIWMVEMPCFALALTANGIQYDLINPPEFGVKFHDDEVISSGSFYHYYRKRTEDHAGAFYESPWCKGDFFASNLLEANLDEFYAVARTDQEQYFFQLARTAKHKLGLSTRASQPCRRLPPTQTPDSILEWVKTYQGQFSGKNGAHAV